VIPTPPSNKRPFASSHLGTICALNAAAAEQVARPALAMTWRLLATVLADDGTLFASFGVFIIFRFF